MQKNSTTTVKVNKVQIAFTRRKMTAYGYFPLIASFFERIGFAQTIEKAFPIRERSPNAIGIYAKNIAVRLIRPIQRQIYSLANWKEIAKGLSVSEFSFMHAGWGKERRYIVVRQNIIRRKKAMGKELPLFANEIDIKDYRYSAWITNAKESPYEVWTMCKPWANDENTIKELKKDFALGGFSMRKFYAVEAAMVLRVLVYNLFLLFKHEFLGKKEKKQHLKTIRYKYFIVPARMGSDERDAILRISAQSRKIWSKLSSLFARISQYIPGGDLNCTAVGDA